MSDYIPNPDTMPQPPKEELNETAGLRSQLRFTNVILTILLVSVLAAGGFIAAMLLGLRDDELQTQAEIKAIKNELSSIADEVEDINDNVDEIMEQGCTGGSSSGSGTVSPINPIYTVDKPVIYLYSEEEMTGVHVEIALDDSEMLVTWPLAEQNDKVFSWDVYANPDGTLYDTENNEYSYLFWEASDYGSHSFDEGFCIAGGDTAEFLRTTLAEIGLTPAEYNEFIVYWLPRMQGNAYNLITFEGLEPADSYNNACRLSVSDQDGNTADSVLRIMMAWKAVDEPVEIEAQEFTTFERNGFTVVEWGGTEIK